jgi:transposase
MKPYPLELRQRIVDAVDKQLGTIEKIAEIFGVTERYLYKLLALRRDTDDLAPRPHGGGAEARLDEPKLLRLAALVAEQPDATLKELTESLNRRRRVRVSLSSVWRGLEKIDCTLKKSPAAPAKPIPQSEPPLEKSR